MVAPRGFTEPLRVAENAATLVAGLVVTTGAVGLGVAVAVGLGVDVGVAVGRGVGVGVGVSDTTLTVPTMAQHPPCKVQ